MVRIKSMVSANKKYLMIDRKIPDNMTECGFGNLAFTIGGAWFDKDPNFFNPDSCTDFSKQFMGHHVVLCRACIQDEV